MFPQHMGSFSQCFEFCDVCTNITKLVTKATLCMCVGEADNHSLRDPLCAWDTQFLKVKLSLGLTKYHTMKFLYLTKHHTMKTYKGVEI